MGLGQAAILGLEFDVEYARVWLLHICTHCKSYDVHGDLRLVSCGALCLFTGGSLGN